MQPRNKVSNAGSLRRYLFTLLVITPLILAGCAATVKQFDAAGNVTSEAKIPLGMTYDSETKKISGDPLAIEALGRAAVPAMEMAGEAVTRYAIEKAAEAK